MGEYQYRRTPPPPSQRDLSRLQYEKEKAELREEMGYMSTQRVAMDSASGPGAGAWMNAPADEGSPMPNADFRTACRLRCHAPVCATSEDGTCQNRKATGALCGKLLDAAGMHATMCGCGGGAIARHNALRDALALLARERNAHVDIEIDVDQAAACPNTGARLDLSISQPGPDGERKNMLVDVAVASPFAQSAGMRAGNAALLADAAKRKK